MQFINRGIDTWFNIEVESGLDDALTLSRNALGVQMRDHLNSTVEAADQLQEIQRSQIIYELGFIRESIGANELTLFGQNSQILATNSDISSNYVPAALSSEMMMQVRQKTDHLLVLTLYQMELMK